MGNHSPEAVLVSKLKMLQNKRRLMTTNLPSSLLRTISGEVKCFSLESSSREGKKNKYSVHVYKSKSVGCYKKDR